MHPDSDTAVDAGEDSPIVHGVREIALEDALEDVADGGGDGVADADDGGDAATVPSGQRGFDPAALNRHIANCARAVCGVDCLRPMQAQVALEVLRPDTPNHVVVAQRTGSGKTLLMRVVGLMLRGLVVIFVPLHALTADVMAKFAGANQRWGAVQAFNLDELFDNAKNVYSDLLDSIRQMHVRTTTTTFAFMSPQFLVHHREALDVLLGAATRRVLRLVVLDEVHVHVQHGTSFRDVIRDLRDVFFRPVFHPSRHSGKIKALFASGTVPSDYIPLISQLTTIPLTIRNVVRGSYADFAQREIKMFQHFVLKRGFTDHKVTPRPKKQLN